MEFREIDKYNYWDCIELTIDDNQEGFVADNKQSLVEAAYEDGLYTLGIYLEETMIGFILYNYDETFPGWSMSRFMIGKQFQGKGYGKKLMEYWESDMKSQGYGMLLTSTQVDEEAQHFYRKLGYKDCGGFVVDIPKYEQPMEMFLIKAI